MSVNVFDDDGPGWETDPEPRPGYCSRGRRLGPAVGAEKLGASIYELAPGERICPYHWHVAEEEWLLVLSGEPTLRTPDGERRMRAWDVVAFPRGPAGAHEVRNDTDEALRVLVLSTDEPVEVAVYPDSDKVGAFARPIGGGERIRMLNRLEANVDYFDGEP